MRKGYAVGARHEGSPRPILEVEGTEKARSEREEGGKETYEDCSCCHLHDDSALSSNFGVISKNKKV